MDQPKLTLDIPFAADEKLWHAVSDQTAGWETCQCCFGKLRITMILGNDERQTVACAMCSVGYDPPSGKTQTYRWRYVPRIFNSERVEISGEDFIYTSIDNQRANANNLTRDYNECKRKCDEMNAKHMDEEKNRHVHQLIQAKKKMAWSVGYWRNQLRKNEEEHARLQERLSIVIEQNHKK